METIIIQFDNKIASGMIDTLERCGIIRVLRKKEASPSEWETALYRLRCEEGPSPSEEQEEETEHVETIAERKRRTALEASTNPKNAHNPNNWHNSHNHR